MKKYQKLAGTLNAWHMCTLTENEGWKKIHQRTIEDIINTLPHGSGIDGETKLNYTKSEFDDKIIIDSSYHAMDSNGFYDKWIDFQVIIKPSLQYGINTDVEGKFGKYQNEKEYIGEQFYKNLLEEYHEVKGK